MAWIELKVQIEPKYAEGLMESLEKWGAVAVTMQDAANQPLYEPAPGTTPLWDSIFVIGLFFEDSKTTDILAITKAAFPHISASIHRLEDKEWEKVWMKDFQPMRFGHRLKIIPSFEAQATRNPFEAILDPGLAFGTGKHPTTALCLEWLDENIEHQEHVIDYGAGSGILAIAAIKLGALHVTAVDHDEQALQATLNNAQKNSISPVQLNVVLPSAVVIGPTADILIANILANPLIELAKHFAKLTKPLGKIALSGILAEQADKVVEAYKPWFVINEIIRKEEWILIDGYRLLN